MSKAKEADARDAVPLGMRKKVFSARQYLDKDVRERLSLYVECPIFLQDPAIEDEHPELGVVSVAIPWEPELGHGPRSSRLVVEDDAPLVKWDAKKHCFVNLADEPVSKEDRATAQFRQLNLWAVVQSIIDYFESSRALGRPVPWGFKGNRLRLLPHAGKKANARYVRETKSLEFFEYGSTKKRYTCLSHDLVAHETGHAILDGIRPLYYVYRAPETAAFHEYVADLTAILISLRRNETRNIVNKMVGGDMRRGDVISGIAKQLGEFYHGKHGPPLRSADNDLKMSDLKPGQSPHHRSQVLMGAMFDILVEITKTLADRGSNAQVWWWAIDYFGQLTLQALDLCPPMDITFRDYARAVLRNDRLVDPVDEREYRKMMAKIFVEREILDASDLDVLDDRSVPQQKIFHDIESISGSETGAYYFLHDNRNELKIPSDVDIEVADLYTTEKMGRANIRLPREVVLLYCWREPVLLQGAKFGKLDGKKVNLLCGGTLVFDSRGNIRSWEQKPGTDSTIGKERKEVLLEHLAAQAKKGRLAFSATEVSEEAPIVVAPLRDDAEDVVELQWAPELRNVSFDEDPAPVTDADTDTEDEP
ncbi:MAG: serine protease [Acidobacteriota bacterium]